MTPERESLIHHRTILKDANMMMAQNATNIVSSIVLGLVRKREDLDCCEWADKYRVMPATSRYRRWSTAKTPYLREPGACLSSEEPAFQFMILAKCAQCGGSELGLNEELRRVHQDPCAMLHYMETDSKVATWYKERFDPCTNREPFQYTDFHKSGNTVEFPGGLMVMHGIGSSTALSSQSAMFVNGDEGSKYPPSIEGEGDFLSLAKQRGITFGSRFKFYMPSTFRDNARGQGTFVTYWEQGDKREYVCPCAECGEEYLWRLDDDTPKLPKGCPVKGGKLVLHKGEPVMVCPHCGGFTHDGPQRTNAVRNGRWVPTKEPDEGFVSFRISGFIVPYDWRPWKQIWNDYRNALEGKEDLQPFYNTVLGLPFNEPEARTPDAGSVEEFCKKPAYKAKRLPKQVKVLTMGVDVQKGYLDYEVRGWAESMESWGIERGRIEHPIDEVVKCKREIDRIMRIKYEASDGSKEFLTVALCMIDRGGPKGSAAQVDKIVKSSPQPGNWKGGYAAIPHGAVTSYHGADAKSQGKILMGEPGGKTTKGLKRRQTFWRIGVDVVKKELYSALNKREEIEEGTLVYGRPHCPKEYDENHFMELVAEQLITERNDKTGRIEQRFYLPPRMANEALDLYVMNRACADILRLGELDERGWKRLTALREQSAKRASGELPPLSREEKRKAGLAARERARNRRKR